MSLLDRIFDRLGWSGPLTRADRPRWVAARTLPDLCELTAQWLEGRIASQPGYYGSVDVDEDDAPDLTDTLVALNRAGFLTNSSQAGFDGLGYDGAHWHLRAAVTGFADDIDWLFDAVDGETHDIVAYRCRTCHRARRNPVKVTYRDGVPVTDFGPGLSRRVIAREMYNGCSAEAIDAVCGAWQITIYDRRFGTNDLWPVLRAAALERGSDQEVPR
jgi:hypothetical protein